MRNVYTLAFVGFISFTGFAAYAQQGGAGVSFVEVMQSLTADGTSSGSSIGDVMRSVTERFMDTGTPTDQPIPAIEGPLVVDVEVPDVNRTVVEVIDTRTERYTPKLKINFAEFPLRSLTEANRPNNGRSVQTSTPTNILVHRIQSRLRVPEFQLAVEERTAIISGTVATERERSLIESMLRFEPGISTVKNEITVVP